MPAAVLCRARRQDDGAGRQHLQQNHQDQVEVDLTTSQGAKEKKESLQMNVQPVTAGGRILACDGFTFTAEGFKTSLQPNQTRQVVVTANVET